MSFYTKKTCIKIWFPAALDQLHLEAGFRRCGESSLRTDKTMTASGQWFSCAIKTKFWVCIDDWNCKLKWINLVCILDLERIDATFQINVSRVIYTVISHRRKNKDSQYECICFACKMEFRFQSLKACVWLPKQGRVEVYFIFHAFDPSLHATEANLSSTRSQCLETHIQMLIKLMVCWRINLLCMLLWGGGNQSRHWKRNMQTPLWYEQTGNGTHDLPVVRQEL